MDSPVPRGPEEIERALACLAAPRARARFRASLKAAFVRGALANGAESPGERFGTALDQLRPARADRAFRARLKERFTSGVLAHDLRDAGDDAPPARGGPGALRLLRWAAPLGLAAAALLLVMRPAQGDRSPWEVVEFPSRGSGEGDGREFAAVDLLPEGHYWRSLHTTSDRLRLRWHEDFLLEVAPDTRVELRPSTADGAQTFVASQGGLNFTSRPGEEPIRILVETADATIEVRGSTVGIDVYGESGTCICVVEGEVIVTTKVGERRVEHVGAGRTCFIHKDGADPTLMPLVAAHGEPVEALRDAAPSLLAPEKSARRR